MASLHLPQTKPVRLRWGKLWEHIGKCTSVVVVKSFTVLLQTGPTLICHSYRLALNSFHQCCIRIWTLLLLLVLKGKQLSRAGILINADTKPSVRLSKSVRSEDCIKEIKFHESSLQGTISGEQDPYQMATMSSKYKGALTLGWLDQRLWVMHCVINLF